MSQVAWELTHSVETEATPAFAWSYMTNVANWDDPPAEFELDGPFAPGSRGITGMPGQEPRQWRLREVSPPRSYTIEAPLDRASLSVEWRFDGLPGGRTRLTQRLALEGENAAAYVEQVRAAFTPTLAAGMNRIAAALARAEAGASRAG